MAKPAAQSVLEKTRALWFKKMETRGLLFQNLSLDSALQATLLSPRATRSLAVLFHGTGNDRFFTWQPLIEDLLAKGRAVLTFDLPGHGQGGTSRLETSTLKSLPAQLEEIITQCGLGHLPRECIAYSLGALPLLAWIEAQGLKPGDRTLLLAVPHQIELSSAFARAESLSLFSRSFWQQWAHFGWRETLPAAGSFRRSSFPIRLANSTEPYPALVARLFAEWRPLRFGHLLNADTLLLFGAEDQLANATSRKLWAEAAPQAKIECVDRANHFLLPFHESTLHRLRAWMDA